MSEPYEELAHVVNDCQDRTCEFCRRDQKAISEWMALRLEQAARQIAEIWGVKGSKDFDEECILGILRETIKGKP